MVLLAAVCLAVGTLDRVLALPHFGIQIFDEGTFDFEARSVLLGRASTNDHPPLGKQIQALFLLRTPLPFMAGRLASLVTGIVTLLCLTLTGALLLGSTGIMLGSLAALDGLFLVYSVTGHLDGPLVCFLSATILFAVQGRCALSGLSLGCAVAVKWSALPSLLAVYYLLLRDGRGRLATRWLRLHAALVSAYLLSWLAYCLPAFHSLESILAEHERLVEAHLHRNFVTAYSSRWYEWLLPSKPIYLWCERMAGDWFRGLLALPNPLLWWTSLAAVFVACGRLFPLRGEPTPPRPGAGYLLGFACTGFASHLLFWVLLPRESFLYHSLPVYLYALVVLVLLVHTAEVGHELKFLLLSLTLLTYLLVRPLWTLSPVPEERLTGILLVEHWMPDLSRQSLLACPAAGRPLPRVTSSGQGRVRAGSGG